MIQILRLAHKWLRSSIAINVALSLLILLPKGGIAYSNNPGDPPPKTMGTSGGSRWHEFQGKTSLVSILDVVKKQEAMPEAKPLVSAFS